MKLPQKEPEKSQKRYKKYYDRKAKSRCLEVGEQVLILLPTDSNTLLMQWRGPCTVESRVVANDYRIKMNKDGVQDKDVPREFVEEVFAREHEVDMVLTSNKDDVAIAVARGTQRY